MPAQFTNGSGRRFPGSWSRKIGDVTLSYLPDAEIELVPTVFLPGSTPEDWAERPDLVSDDGYLVAGAGTLLVQSAEWSVLVDAGFGPNSAGRDSTPQHLGAMRSGRLPSSLAEAGVDPAGVEVVAFTHLHRDHMGWATPGCTGGGRSLFPNARWLVGENELAGQHRTAQWVLAGESERAVSVAAGSEPLAGVRSLSLPGHTSGHTAWVFETGAEQLVLFGDALHSPAQAERPDWAVGLDSDGAAAEESRRQLLRELSRPDVLGVGIHFADQQLGRVVDGRWVPPDA